MRGHQWYKHINYVNQCPISYSVGVRGPEYVGLLPHLYRLLPIAYCLLPTAYCLLLLSFAYCLLHRDHRLLPGEVFAWRLTLSAGTWVVGMGLGRGDVYA